MHRLQIVLKWSQLSPSPDKLKERFVLLVVAQMEHSCSADDTGFLLLEVASRFCLGAVFDFTIALATT